MNLKKREDKMGEKIKNIERRDFLKNLASWKSFIFYKRDDNVTLYPDVNRIGPLHSNEDYEKIRDSFDKYGRGYNFNKSFFDNYKDLFTQIPCVRLKKLLPYENSEYIDSGGYGIKNCYLSIGPFSDCENVLYSFEVKEKCSNVYSSVMVRNGCSNVFNSVGIINSYNTFYSKFIFDSSNLWFCTNMIGCSECIDCDNLQNQSYCIDNIQYSQEEYRKKKKEILKDKNNFYTKFLNLASKGNNIESNNVRGSFNVKCENIENGYLNFNIHGGRNLILAGSTNGNKYMYNTFVCGSPHMDHAYHCLDSGGGDYMYNSERSAMSSHVYYCYYIENCSYCLGCIGIKNKQFYILNKQYSKEERFEKANEIFEQMEKDGILGDFFPGSMNPFYFNDTAAYLIDDSFTKEEVEKEGYLRRDEEIKVDIPEGAEMVSTTKGGNDKMIKSLDDFEGFDENGEWKIDPEIMKKVIRDEKGNCYKIVKMEYDFLVKHGLPLPRLHRLDRIKLGFKFK
ncbi:MAG TPA: hypothetical protein P5060_02090 [Candidatus Absconditabacterales bacterium]|nr:hypothetical protein [Candidatus Absconditabacterales bacterium]